MEKKSIGKFIATLRKANGMTQQNVADRLNVSNKAVSRWERDECSPDISVIPALAELFGVTCDELLKGERILESAPLEKKEPKVEKQVKNLISRTISGFKTLIWISMTVAVVGLICMFGISYGFYRPVIGFAVMLLFEVCALVIAILAVSRTKDVKNDNELFEKAEESLVSKFNHTLGTQSFIAFFLIFAVVLLSLPLVLFTSDYVYSVIPIHSYRVFFGGIVLILMLIYLKCKKLYLSWINNGEFPQRPKVSVEKPRLKMTLAQVVLTIIAGVLFVIAPCFEYKPNETSLLYTVVCCAGLTCLLANVIIFFVTLLRQKGERKKLLIPGIRNVLFIPSALIVSEMHNVEWSSFTLDESGWSSDNLTRYDNWYMETLVYALVLAGIVFIVFSLIEIFIQKRKK